MTEKERQQIKEALLQYCDRLEHTEDRGEVYSITNDIRKQISNVKADRGSMRRLVVTLKYVEGVIAGKGPLLGEEVAWVRRLSKLIKDL